MKIEIDTIPHDKQRYQTLGDWFYLHDPTSRAEKLVVKVSETGDWRSNALIAVHELVEVLLCKQAGITQEAVDEFDKQFEKERECDQCGGSGFDTPGTGYANVCGKCGGQKYLHNREPGDDPKAPYHTQHYVAMQVERYLCEALGMHWDEHQKRCEETDK